MAVLGGLRALILRVSLFLGGPADQSFLRHQAPHAHAEWLQLLHPLAALVSANVGDGSIAASHAWVGVQFWLWAPVLPPALEGFKTHLDKALSNLV